MADGVEAHEHEARAPLSPSVDSGDSLSAASAVLFAFLGSAAVNASVVLVAPDAPLAVRAQLAAFELGHQLTLGIAGWWLVARPPARLRLALPALLVLLVGVGWLWVAPDFASFSERLDHPELRVPLGILAALSVLLPAIAGRYCRRPLLRSAALGAAVLVVLLNHRILQADYPGIHLLLAWHAVALAAGSLAGARLPKALRAASRWLDERRRRAWLSATILPLSSLSFLTLPKTAVLVQAFRSEGLVLFPFVVPLHGVRSDEGAPESESTSLGLAARFLGPREGLPEIPPSQPSLAPARPLVMLITIDAMRADLLARPEWRQRLPHLAGLANESVEFRQARSPGSTTRNSMGQVFSSRYASQLRWRKAGRFTHLRDEPTPRLTDSLRGRGFATLHVVPIATLESEHAVVGRFEHETFVKSTRKGQRFALSSASVKEALKLLKRHADGPTFLYMHWLDAHDPYDAAGEEGTTFERYLREVELADQSFGKLLEGLRRQQLWDRAVVVVTADHGEALGDHGIPHHGGGIYESLVRVPLLIRVPGVRSRRVDVPVTTLDIAPTLLDLLGYPTPAQYMGQSLVGFLRGRDPTLDRPIGIDEGRLRIFGLVVGGYKVIEHRRRRTVEIYDLSRDPAETTNLYGSLPGGKDEQLLASLRLLFAPRREGEPPGADD